MREGDHFEDPGVYGRTQLNGAEACTRLIWLRIWTGDGLL